MKEEKKIVRVAFPMDLYEKLKKEAENTTRTVPGYIRYIVKQFLEGK